MAQWLDLGHNEDASYHCYRVSYQSDMNMIELTEVPIDASAVLAQVADPECGAEVLFVGTTRQWTAVPQPPRNGDASTADVPERIETSHLIYESYRTMAFSQMQQLEAEARTRWPLRQVAMVHRLGHVAATEVSVAIAVSSPHRSEAFEAAQWLIDELKHRVPIWKQEHYVQHGSQWIHPTQGSCRCAPPSQTQGKLPINSIAPTTTDSWPTQSTASQLLPLRVTSAREEQ